MNKLRKAEICDAIIYSFLGNVAHTWNEIHTKEYYEKIDSNYYVVENMINFLVGEGQLKREMANNVERIKLTDKGFGTLGDMENEGYATKLKITDRKERRDKNTFKAVIASIIVTIIMPFIPTKFNETSPKKFQTSPQIKDSIRNKVGF